MDRFGVVLTKPVGELVGVFGQVGRCVGCGATTVSTEVGYQVAPPSQRRMSRNGVEAQAGFAKTMDPEHGWAGAHLP